MLTIKAMAEGATYDYLSQKGDYYAEGECVKGQWIGHGSELLGLKGEVALDDFESIRQGNDPRTGEFLRQRHSADRHTKDGEVQASARNLYDMVFSAPKDMSILAMVDNRVDTIHDEAVDYAFQELERAAGAYVRKDGAQDTRLTGNVVGAKWRHDSSRELDPQIHTHLTIFNLTRDEVEGKWKALAPYQIYQLSAMFTEVYRNYAVNKLHQIGYETELRFEKGQYNGFGIQGVTGDMRELYSRRSAQRQKAEQEFITEHGRLPTKKEIAQLILETRAPKLPTVQSTEQVKSQQFSRLDNDQKAALRSLPEQAAARGDISQAVSPDASLDHAQAHLFERVSVAKHQELKAQALIHGQGRIDFNDLKAELERRVIRGELLSARGEMATEETRQREEQLVTRINNGVGRYQALNRDQAFTPDAKLTAEQKNAVNAVLACRDFAMDIDGAAGAGKTTTLKEIHRGLHEARRSVMAVAPQQSSADVLKQEGFGDAITIARLLVDPMKQEELRGQVLFLDEAGMVGAKDMAALVALAESKGARLLTVGDTKQIKSVEQGDALRILRAESKLQRTTLHEVHRQKTAAYKQAVHTLRHSPGKGYALLEEMGAIKQVDWRMRGYAAAEAYRIAAWASHAKAKARSVLVVAPTWEEISIVTHAIRQERKRAGELGDSQTLTRHSPLNWTEAQKKQTANYCDGQMLIFHKAVKGVAAKNEAFSVIHPAANKLQARRVNGELITIRKQDASAYGVFEADGIEVCAGDKLLLQANWKDKAFKATNGELVTVASVDAGAVRLADGRQLPESYKQFTHGYAVTAHRSQGKTVDHVVILADKMARDLFYVTVTRGREALNIITSDKLALQEAIGVDADRQSATELYKNVLAAAQRAAAKIEFSIEELHHSFTQSRQNQSRQNQDGQRIAPQKDGYHVTQTTHRHAAGI